MIFITGTSKGIGRSLAEHYTKNGTIVYGCSRSQSDYIHSNYKHFVADVSDEGAIKKIFFEIYKSNDNLEMLINNAGVASMNHSILTPLKTVNRIFRINVGGTFLCSVEAAKIMKKFKFGRIVNISSIAVPLKLEGEAAYAASKAAVETLTEIFAKEFSSFGVTVNAIGPVPIKTDLIGSVSQEKIQQILQKQAISRYGDIKDIINIIDFLRKPESEIITGQIIYLGGV